MSPRRELGAFGTALAGLVAILLGPALLGGKVLSPADVVLVQRGFVGPAFEPKNRLLMDPVLQFEPWIEFNREMLRSGRLPLWNGRAGCGAPHLANGQSAVFDPFHLIAYLGPMPGALGWMAAARLWVAGLGMFLLARGWGLGPWGRWFAGLAYPFCGFLVFWLLYPVASVAVWLPWLVLAGDRFVARPSAGSAAGVALATAATMAGGHVQTSAHVLLAAGIGVLFRLIGDRDGTRERCRIAAAWAASVGLGVAAMAVTMIPLGVYLSRSPVWEERRDEGGPPWVLARPRLIEATATALPYALGSQRRGHPNLAKALGANNVNEAAGGFAGLATLLWLAPLGATRSGVAPRRFLVAVATIGALGAFRLPPVDNLLRALPVLEVTDNRRLTLWVAFGLVGLGAIGLDGLAGWRPSARWRAWATCWVAGAAALAVVAVLIPRSEPRLRALAEAHYTRVISGGSEGPTAAEAHDLADRQVRNVVAFLPRYYGGAATGLSAMAALLAWFARRPADRAFATRAALLGLALLDLLGTARGANPAIEPEAYRPESPMIAMLRREAPRPLRVLGVGSELPPNLAMRYGLADVRNYDSVELSGVLDWLDPLFEPGGSRSSRREVPWDGVARARDRLRACGVAAAVGASEPPPGLFDRVESTGSVWVGLWDGMPAGGVGPSAVVLDDRDGRVTVEVAGIATDRPDRPMNVSVPIPDVPGWRAESGGRRLDVGPGPGPWLSVAVPPGVRRLELRYEPPEVRVGVVASAAAWATLCTLGIAAIRPVKKGAKALGPARTVAIESIPWHRGPGGAVHLTRRTER